MPKKRILVFIDWYLPAYKAGGPVQSIKNLVQNLSPIFDFYILCSDRDLGDLEPYTSIEVNTWIAKENCHVMYLSTENQSIKKYKELILTLNPHKIYINSIFSFPFAIKALMASFASNQKVVLAPRGMLGLGALKIKSTKKKVFLSVFKCLNWHKKIHFHSTSGQETQEIKHQFGDKVTLSQVSNFSAALPPFVSKSKEKGSLNLFFLSRINKKKNLLFALHILSELDSQEQIQFTIFGPIDGEEYWQKCQEIIQKMPSNVSISYKGAISNDELATNLKNQHLLFLPTFNENYGHAIVEAWQNSCLVLISDQTPWQNLENKNMGWEYPLDNPKSFKKALQTALEYSQQEWQEKSLVAYTNLHQTLGLEQLSGTMSDLLFTKKSN